jgi:hypothetical protein
VLSAGLSPEYLHTSLFIPTYQTAVEIISPVEIATESTNFQYKLWENHDLTPQPVIAYIYLCGRDGMHPVYITFKNVILLQTRK